MEDRIKELEDQIEQLKRKKLEKSQERNKLNVEICDLRTKISALEDERNQLYFGNPEKRFLHKYVKIELDKDVNQYMYVTEVTLYDDGYIGLSGNGFIVTVTDEEISGYTIVDSGFAMESVDDEHVTLLTKELFNKVNKETLQFLRNQKYESS